MLSVIVIAKNEEDRIKTCLESVKFADEIIVFDNGSTDNTVKIARGFTDRVYSADISDFANLRNKAMEKATGDWVLYVDADERILEPLKSEITQIISSESDKSAYALSRRNVIFGTEAKYGPFWPDWVIRLVRKDRFKTWVGMVHEYMTFEGNLGYTKNSLLHLTHRGVDQMIKKNLEWSKIDAKLRFDANHPKMSGWRFLRIFVTETFSQGIIRRGFFGGTVGVMDSLIQVFSMLTTYIRLWEMQQPKLLDEIYDEIDQNLAENKFNYK
ncbi:MAG: glycosyltransferase family 2 protein [Candidatus Daviesbacteria bacterium]|nr:glycosyltransferase family 2 protein [Candidatus Daviesbacteria bacterium]